nr:TetR/AcrR family transcriptional regulator C-terminal domain-containing protein [Halomonas socia]
MAIQRDHVIQTALKLLDEGGIEGLTLRKVAQVLDVKAPSLYWHFANKQALLDAVADALIEDVGHDIPPGQHWRDTLRQIAEELRQALKSHRDAARVFAGTYVATENVLRPGEAMLSALLDAGADIEFAANTIFHIGYYVMGFVIEEQAVSDDKIDMEQRTATFLALAKERFPKFHRAAHVLFEPDFDARFTVGVDLLLAGIEQRLTALPQSEPRVGKKR